MAPMRCAPQGRSGRCAGALHGARRGPRRVRFRAILALSALLAMAVLSALAAAQVATQDARNKLHKEAIDARCYACHETDLPPFRPMSLGFAEAYRTVVPGEPFNVSLRIANPWGHQLLDIVARMDLGNATGFGFVTEPPRPAFVLEETAQLERTVRSGRFVVAAPESAATEQYELPVAPNVTRIEVHAATDPGPGALLGHPPSLELLLWPPGGYGQEPLEGAPGENAGEYSFRLDDPVVLNSYPQGTWRLNVTYADGLEPQIAVDVTATVSYEPASPIQLTVAAPKTTLLNEGQWTLLSWTLVAGEEAEGVLDVTVRARAHFDHPGIPEADDDGTFLRFITVETRSGDRLEAARAGGGPPVKVFVPTVNAANLATRLAGFASALLVPLSMVTGGMFGKGSRRVMNRRLGGARRRVLWHGSMSWAILAVATVHLALALVETRFAWTKGLLWGGIGFLAMASLGLTGALQVRIIKRWDFRAWRRLHLGAAIGLFFVGLLHVLVDGSDLGGVREAVPPLEWLSWP